MLKRDQPKKAKARRGSYDDGSFNLQDFIVKVSPPRRSPSPSTTPARHTGDNPGRKEPKDNPSPPTPKNSGRSCADLRCAIDELKSFDVSTIKQRPDPRAKALTDRINNTLADIFGRDTEEYDNHSIRSLDTLPITIGGAWHPLSEVRQGYQKGIADAIVMLSPLLGKLEEKLPNQEKEEKNPPSLEKKEEEKTASRSQTPPPSPSAEKISLLTMRARLRDRSSSGPHDHDEPRIKHEFVRPQTRNTGLSGLKVKPSQPGLSTTAVPGADKTLLVHERKNTPATEAHNEIPGRAISLETAGNIPGQQAKSVINEGFRPVDEQGDEPGKEESNVPDIILPEAHDHTPRHERISESSDKPTKKPAFLADLEKMFAEFEEQEAKQATADTDEEEEQTAGISAEPTGKPVSVDVMDENTGVLVLEEPLTLEELDHEKAGGSSAVTTEQKTALADLQKRLKQLVAEEPVPDEPDVDLILSGETEAPIIDGDGNEEILFINGDDDTEELVLDGDADTEVLVIDGDSVLAEEAFDKPAAEPVLLESLEKRLEEFGEQATGHSIANTDEEEEQTADISAEPTGKPVSVDAMDENTGVLVLEEPLTLEELDHEKAGGSSAVTAEQKTTLEALQERLRQFEAEEPLTHESDMDLVLSEESDTLIIDGDDDTEELIIDREEGAEEVLVINADEDVETLVIDAEDAATEKSFAEYDGDTLLLEIPEGDQLDDGTLVLDGDDQLSPETADEIATGPVLLDTLEKKLRDFEALESSPDVPATAGNKIQITEIFDESAEKVATTCLETPTTEFVHPEHNEHLVEFLNKQPGSAPLQTLKEKLQEIRAKIVQEISVGLPSSPSDDPTDEFAQELDQTRVTSSLAEILEQGFNNLEPKAPAQEKLSARDHDEPDENADDAAPTPRVGRAVDTINNNVAPTTGSLPWDSSPETPPVPEIETRQKNMWEGLPSCSKTGNVILHESGDDPTRIVHGDENLERKQPLQAQTDTHEESNRETTLILNGMDDLVVSGVQGPEQDAPALDEKHQSDLATDDTNDRSVSEEALFQTTSDIQKSLEPQASGSRDVEEFSVPCASEELLAGQEPYEFIPEQEQLMFGAFPSEEPTVEISVLHEQEELSVPLSGIPENEPRMPDIDEQPNKDICGFFDPKGDEMVMFEALEAMVSDDGTSSALWCDDLPEEPTQLESSLQDRSYGQETQVVCDETSSADEAVNGLLNGDAGALFCGLDDTDPIPQVNAQVLPEDSLQKLAADLVHDFPEGSMTIPVFKDELLNNEAAESVTKELDSGLFSGVPEDPPATIQENNTPIITGVNETSPETGVLSEPFENKVGDFENHRNADKQVEIKPVQEMLETSTNLGPAEEIASTEIRVTVAPSLIEDKILLSAADGESDGYSIAESVSGRANGESGQECNERAERFPEETSKKPQEPVVPEKAPEASRSPFEVPEFSKSKGQSKAPRADVLDAHIVELRCRIEDLKSFDITTVKERFDPRAKALGDAVSNTLATIFGRNTPAYWQHAIPSLDAVLVVVGGPKPSPDEVQDAYRRGINDAVAKLTATLEGLDEKRRNLAAQGPDLTEPDALPDPPSDTRVFNFRGREEPPGTPQEPVVPEKAPEASRSPFEVPEFSKSKGQSKAPRADVLDAHIVELRCRIEDLKSFDITTVKERFDPRAKALGDAVSNTLATIFGRNTPAYWQHAIPSLDAVLVVVGGPKPSPDEVQDAYRRGINDAVAKLTATLEGLDEKRRNLAAQAAC
ncbi:MAG: hypothetical protein A4E62_01954 [Syntrophorhabdus sp. PtaU1.Bin002]|nr:MAG: hypothetical protein A4E62_01954 [Syntrophorhabdus sp. PtaU1.Bin002]